MVVGSAGQPTKYRPEYAEMLIDFFSAAEVVEGEERAEATIFPTLARFACNIGVHRETLINWANASDASDNLINPEFFDAYKRAKEYQEAFIYEGGMSGAVNPTFAIWSAKAILGHRDTDTQQTEEAKPLSIVFNTIDARKDA